MSHAASVLREVLDQILDDRDYRPRDVEVKGLTSGGANYTSSLFFVNVSSPSHDDLKLFAKVACIGDSIRAIMSADWLYTTERLVYTQVVKIYKDLEDMNGVPDKYRFIFPKCYGCSSELGKETVVMEDLVENGFKTYDRLKSMDWAHASSAVENLARFHGLSFAFAKYYPEEFSEMTSDMKFKMGSEQEPSDEMKALWHRMIENYLEVIVEEHRDLVRKYLFDHRPSEMMRNFTQPRGRPVISHGDYRMSNILFRKRNDTLESIAVDYQTVHAGCPAADLIYFIFLGSDEQFRQQHYDQLLDHYHASLMLALERLAVDPGVYTRQKFDSDIKELLPCAVLLGVMVLPVVTVEAESAPKVDGDADVSNFVVKPNDLFADRFSGIVNDLIRWGAL